MFRTLFVAILFFFSIGHAETLENQIANRAKEYGASAVGIYFEASDGDAFSINSNAVFHAASTMKVPVMMEIFRKVEKGKLRLAQPVTIKNQFKSIVDGSLYTLTPEEDTDTEIYKLIGQTLTLGQLVERMINQ